MQLNHRNTTKAFTLIELLVVVAIVALLAAILLPALQRARQQAKSAVCLSNLHQVAVAFETYGQDHRDQYPAALDPVSGSPFYWLWMGRGFRAFIGPYLVDDINVENPSVLLCPADKSDPGTFENTSYAYSLAFYHSPEQIDAATHYSACYSSPQPPVAQTPTNVRFPARKILCGDWGSYHQPIKSDNGWWDERGTRNFLFPDGHAATFKTSQIARGNDGLPDPNLTLHGIEGRDIW